MLRFGQTAKIELRVDMQADTAADLSISGITREGAFTYKATTPSNSLNTSISFGLSDIPIMVSVRDTAAALVQGSAFISLSLVINGNIVQQLTSGYVYNQKALSWPQAQQVDLRPGGGKLTTVVGANPGAGNEFSVTVPAGELWKLHSIAFVFNPSAVVGNRFVKVSITSFGQEILEITPTAYQVTGGEYDFWIGEFGTTQYGKFDIAVQSSLPTGLVVGPGGIIQSFTDTIDAGDDYSAPIIHIEKYFTTS